tara:strand:- start:1137 stop:1643 length:507 start_codon:yes stop_codon:yes gene_type:complete
MRYILALIIVVIIVGCQDVKRPEEPKDLIPQDQMVDILTETYLINAARSYDIKEIRKKRLKLDSFIFKKFKIDSSQFARSNDYYTSNLNLYNSLFERVEQKLNGIKARTDSVYKIIEKERAEKRRQDSIRGFNLDSIDALEADTLSVFNKAPQLIEPQEIEVDQDSLE